MRWLLCTYISLISALSVYGQRLYFDKDSRVDIYAGNLVYDYHLDSILFSAQFQSVTPSLFDGTYVYVFCTSFPYEVIDNDTIYNFTPGQYRYRRNIYTNYYDQIELMDECRSYYNLYAQSGYCVGDTCYYCRVDYNNELYYAIEHKNSTKLNFKKKLNLSSFLPEYKGYFYFSFGHIGSTNYLAAVAFLSTDSLIFHLFKFPVDDVDQITLISEEVQSRYFFDRIPRSLLSHHYACDSTLFLFPITFKSDTSDNRINAFISLDPNNLEKDTLWTPLLDSIVNQYSFNVHSFDNGVPLAPACTISTSLDADESTQSTYFGGSKKLVKPMQQTIKVADNDVSLLTNGGRIASITASCIDPIQGDSVQVAQLDNYTIRYNDDHTVVSLTPHDKFDVNAAVDAIGHIYYQNGDTDRAAGLRLVEIKLELTSGQTSEVYSEILVNSTTSTTDKIINEKIKIVPKSGGIWLYGIKNDSYNYMLYDVTGQIIQRGPLLMENYISTIDVTTLPMGMYILHLIDNDNTHVSAHKCLLMGS